MENLFSKLEDLNVNDNKKAGRYEIKLGEEFAFSEYRIKDGKAYFLHSVVPEAYRGKGIADKLIRFALDDVIKQGLKIIPWCPFVAAFINKHADYQKYT